MGQFLSQCEKSPLAGLMGGGGSKSMNVAGVEDVRFQSLMPDVLLWLGVTKIDQLMSMSDMKYNAIVRAGIEVVNRIPIPPERVPADAQVEMAAKVFAGYEGGQVYNVTAEDLKKVKGRDKSEF